MRWQKPLAHSYNNNNNACTMKMSAEERQQSLGMPLKIRGGFNVTFVDFEWSRPPCTVVDKLFLAIASLLHPSTTDVYPSINTTLHDVNQLHGYFVPIVK